MIAIVGARLPKVGDKVVGPDGETYIYVENNGAKNPLWKRSGFGQMVLYAVSVAAWRIFDGVAIGSEEVITFATMALLLLGYQARKPSGPVSP